MSKNNHENHSNYLENHDLEWATDIYYPLNDENRLKKEIIYFINKLTY